jgi:putative ABC transport system substrate-binding protein
VTDRRAFIDALAAGLLAAPLAAWAQPASKVYRIGVLLSDIPWGRLALFFLRTPLHHLGYDEGRNLVFEVRSAQGHKDRLAALAAELIAHKVDLIVAPLNPEILAAKRATSTIPIVMIFASTPVESGLVASLARPGGNVTGTAVQSPELAGKMLEALRDAVPRLASAACLLEPEYPGIHLYRHQSERAAEAMGIRLTFVHVHTAAELDGALGLIAQDRPDALLVSMTGAIVAQYPRVIDFAARQRLPALYSTKGPVIDGGLMSYAADFAALARRSVAMIDRILKGARPADLPVEQPAKFELVINLRTAKAIGLTIPQSLLLRADEVIQ